MCVRVFDIQMGGVRNNALNHNYSLLPLVTLPVSHLVHTDTHTRGVNAMKHKVSISPPRDVKQQSPTLEYRAHLR